MEGYECTRSIAAFNCIQKFLWLPNLFVFFLKIVLAQTTPLEPNKKATELFVSCGESGRLPEGNVAFIPRELVFCLLTRTETLKLWTGTILSHNLQVGSSKCWKKKARSDKAVCYQTIRSIILIFHNFRRKIPLPFNFTTPVNYHLTRRVFHSYC